MITMQLPNSAVVLSFDLDAGWTIVEAGPVPEIAELYLRIAELETMPYEDIRSQLDANERLTLVLEWAQENVAAGGTAVGVTTTLDAYDPFDGFTVEFDGYRVI